LLNDYTTNDTGGDLKSERLNDRGLRYNDNEVESKELKSLEKNEKLFTSFAYKTEKMEHRNKSQESTGNTHVDNILQSKFESRLLERVGFANLQFLQLKKLQFGSSCILICKKNIFVGTPHLATYILHFFQIEPELGAESILA
jgi:hypothetical protein